MSNVVHSYIHAMLAEMQSLFERKFMNKVLKPVANTMGYIAMAAILLVVGLNGYEIFGRLVFEKSNYWIQDVTMLLMVWFVFPGMVKVVWEKKDILVDIIPNALPKAPRRILSIFVHVMIILFSGAMTYASGKYLYLTRSSKTITAHIPSPLITCVMVFAFFMFMLIYLHNLIQLLKNKDDVKALGGRE